MTDEIFFKEVTRIYYLVIEWIWATTSFCGLNSQTDSQSLSYSHKSLSLSPKQEDGYTPKCLLLDGKSVDKLRKKERKDKWQIESHKDNGMDREGRDLNVKTGRENKTRK